MDSRLHAAWLSQLTREYNDICYQYRVRLQPPVRDDQPQPQAAGQLVGRRPDLESQPFPDRQTPLEPDPAGAGDEMAHQMVSEIHRRDDVGHGPLFREACARIGLDAPFHRASADLEEGLADAGQATAATEQGRQVIDKVRKLLALATTSR